MKKTLEQKVNKILKLLEDNERRENNNCPNTRYIRYVDKKTNETVACVFDPMFIPPFPPMGMHSSSQIITLKSANTNGEEKRYQILIGEYEYKLDDQLNYIDGVNEEELTVYVEEVK